MLHYNFGIYILKVVIYLYIYWYFFPLMVFRPIIQKRDFCLYLHTILSEESQKATKSEISFFLLNMQ